MADKLEFTEQTADAHVINEQQRRSGAIGLAETKAKTNGEEIDLSIFGAIEGAQRANLQELAANLKNAARNNSREMADKAYEKFETDVEAQVMARYGANQDTPDGNARRSQVERAFSLVDSESTITGKITSGIGEVAGNAVGAVKEQLVDAKGDGKTSGIIGALVGGLIAFMGFGGGFEGGILDSLFSILVIGAGIAAGAFAGNWISEAADSKEGKQFRHDVGKSLSQAKDKAGEVVGQGLDVAENAVDTVQQKVQPLTEEAAKKLAAQRDSLLAQFGGSEEASSGLPHNVAIKSGSGKRADTFANR